MDISSLEAFVAVARHQSFSKASEQMHITQPAVSKRIAGLESELGIELFNRVARQTSLTEAGQQLLPRAQELINQARDMQRYASNLNRNIGGVLSIAISHHIGLHRMPPILREFNQRFPDVVLDIRFEDSEQAFHAVEKGDIEFAVITLPSELADNLRAEAVWTDQLHIVVASDHPILKIDRMGIAELAAYPAVLPGSETETFKIVDRCFSRRKLEMKVQMTTNNLETLKMLVIAGVGWSILPSNMLNHDLTGIDIGLSLNRKLGLVYHLKRSPSNAANALRKLIFSHR
jgi:DNA-binding transcriptional LysR family regulator